MGYAIRKSKKSWRVIYRSYENNKEVSRKIEPGTPEYESLGLSPLLSLEDAISRVQLIQKETELNRIAKKRHSATIRRHELNLIESAYLPGNLVTEFEEGYLKLLGKRKDRWLIVKALIAKLDIGPHEWHFQPEKIYQFFIDRADSLDYARRLLKLFNKWGAFYCLKTGKPFLAIDPPSGHIRRAIRATYFKTKPDRSTTIIQPSDLNRYHSFYLSLMLWFGLRPREVRMMTSNQPDKWRIQTDDPRFKYVLHLFQEKLLDAGIEPRLCWKAIPAVEPEQVNLIAPLVLGTSASSSLPALDLPKDLKFTERSLRKSFVAVMQQRGYSESCISHWLGHVGSTTQRRHYLTKEIAVYEPPFRRTG